MRKGVVRVKRLWVAVCICAALMPRASALSASAAVTMDADTGETLFASNADSRLPMASTTKIMTALVALGEGGLDRVFTVKREYMAEGSSMYLQEGERLTLREALYGLLLSSGNDAAAAVAGECGGMTAFVEKMNAKAAELGLSDTHFENPSGLPAENHYTTARELAEITAAALRDPVFRDMVSTKTCTAAGRTLVNHNRLLSMYDGAIGVKTGFTRAAGRCLVSAAERNGRTVIAVTLNDPDDWNDHIALLDDAFSRYSEVTLHEKGDTLAEVRVFGGESEKHGHGVSAAERKGKAAPRALRRKILLRAGGARGLRRNGRVPHRGRRSCLRPPALRRRGDDKRGKTGRSRTNTEKDKKQVKSKKERKKSEEWRVQSED